MCNFGRRQALRPAAARATAPSIQQIPAVGSPPVFQGLQAYRLPPLKLLNLLNPPSRSQDRPRPTVFKGVQGCRLPGSTPLKPAKPSEGPPRQALRPAAAQGHSPFNSTNSSGWHAQLFFRVFKATVCPPSKLLNPLNFTAAARTGHVQLFLRVFKAAVCPALNPLNAPNPLQGPAGKPYVQQQPGPQPLQFNKFQRLVAHLFFRVFKATVCPPLMFLNPLNPPSRSQDRPRPTVFKGVQGCRLPGLKPLKRSKRFAGPRRQAVRPAAASATTPSINKFQPLVAHLLISVIKPTVCPPPGQATSNCF